MSKFYSCQRLLQAGPRQARQSVRGLVISSPVNDRSSQPTGRAGHISPYIRTPFFHERAPPIGIDKSLQERLDELHFKHGVHEEKIDIGFSTDKERIGGKDRVSEWRRKTRSDKALEKAAREGTLTVDLDVVREQWIKSGQVFHDILESAELYGIYDDLFKHGFFRPCVMLNIDYDLEDGETSVPVFRGNIVKPMEASLSPNVSWDSGPDTLWTLSMVGLDTHLTSPGSEYLHWMVSNIQGSDISTGELMCDYLQPFPPYGTGYHRYAFVLYHQGQNIDMETERRELGELDLTARTFSTFDFYSKYQETITPAGLAFFQSDYDTSLGDFFHNKLNMKEPRYMYEFPEPYVQSWSNFFITNKSKGFDEFINRHRDPKDVEREVLVKKLAHTCPFEGDLEDKEMKFPGIHGVELEDQIPAPIGDKRFNPKQSFKIPQWRRNAVHKERMREGYFSSKDHSNLRRDPHLNS